MEYKIVCMLTNAFCYFWSSARRQSAVLNCFVWRNLSKTKCWNNAENSLYILNIAITVVAQDTMTRRLLWITPVKFRFCTCYRTWNLVTRCRSIDTKKAYKPPNNARERIKEILESTVDSSTLQANWESTSLSDPKTKYMVNLFAFGTVKFFVLFWSKIYWYLMTVM